MVTEAGGAGWSRETTLVLTIDGATKHGWSKMRKRSRLRYPNSCPYNTQLGKLILEVRDVFSI